MQRVSLLRSLLRVGCFLKSVLFLAIVDIQRFFSPKPTWVNVRIGFWVTSLSG
jgi:hypothetical protein